MSATYTNRRLAAPLVSLWFALFLSACATDLTPVSLPTETAEPPSQAAHWLELESIRSDNWFYLLNDGPAALDWRLRAIDSATQEIVLQTFLWQFDTAGTLLTNHLMAAADRGVRIRILIDDSFTVGQDGQISDLAVHKNIEYKIFNPFKRRADSVATRQILNLGDFHRLDHRMHNKSMVVDNRVAIVGGRNLADSYFGLGEKGNFRDIEILVGGAITQDISSAFDRYWNDQWSFPALQVLEEGLSDDSGSDENAAAVRNVGVHIEEDERDRTGRWISIVNTAPTGSPVLLVDDPPVSVPGSADSSPVQLAADIIELIDEADSELRIVSAYLIPTENFEAAIERAENRGVEVHLLTNSIQSNNHLTAHSAYRHHIERLVDHGADLHEVRVDANSRSIYTLPPPEEKLLGLHAKLMLVDRKKVFIGSANFDPRSLRINTEMGLIIEDPLLGRQVFEAIHPDFSPQNSWHIRRGDSGNLEWVSDTSVLDRQPAHSFMQRIEDWFFALLPLDNEM